MTSENVLATRENYECSQRMKKTGLTVTDKNVDCRRKGKVSQIISQFNADASETTSQRTIQYILHPMSFSSRRLTCLTLLKSPY